MAATGILLRRDTKANLVLDPPLVGELVFALDTGEHGWLDGSSTLTWRAFDAAPSTLSVIEYEYTAIEGQTVITGLDNNANTLDYAGYIQVFVDGSKLSTPGFVETDNLTVTLVVPATVGQELNIVVYS